MDIHTAIVEVNVLPPNVLNCIPLVVSDPFPGHGKLQCQTVFNMHCTTSIQL